MTCAAPERAAPVAEQPAAGPADLVRTGASGRWQEALPDMLDRPVIAEGSGAGSGHPGLRHWMEQLLPRMRRARLRRELGLCADCGGAVARPADLACPQCVAAAIAMH